MNQSVDRLHDISIFFSSTAAQVWAAFLIFIVLLLRDLASRKRVLTKEIWRDARLLWKDLIPELENRVRTDPAQTSNWKVDSNTLQRANTHSVSFERLLEAISRHQIVLKIGKAQPGPPLTLLHFHKTLDCEEWQRVFDNLNRDLQDSSTGLAPPLRSLRLSLFATAGNLFFLALPSYLAETAWSLRIIMSCLLLLNFWMGRVFYDQVKRSLKFVA